MTEHLAQRVMSTKVALQLPGGLAFDEWEQTGSQLAGVLSSSSWWLGDWLIYGREHYRDRYERAIHLVGVQYQTLRNYAWVAGRFPAGRRRAALSFQHHAEVASMPVEEQEHWLHRAQQQRWTLRQLRAALREARRELRPADGPTDEQVRRLAIPAERFRRWYDAASRTGTDVEQWMLATLDTAAEQILTP